MTLDELIRLAGEARIESLDLRSLEGGIYLLEVSSEGRSRPLRDARGKSLQVRSVEHARQLLQTVPDVPFYLVHAEAHDEMCGMPAGRREPLRVPIALRSSW